ncbi:MAG: hypothetical protein HUU49_02200 [Candidatus Buchananbacteria bacterium]|nr:hypothetical protein [Candidatus Buchananbacteria bacterium]
MYKSYKIVKRLVIFLTVAAILAIGWLFLFSLDFGQQEVNFGVTFSDKYASDLELNWQESYLAILDDLGVDKIRLIAYWDDIEAIQDQFDFSKLDWQLAEAERRDVEVILTVGRRAPRWPECHDPAWINDLAKLAVQQHQLEFVKETINRYRDRQVVKSWQIENEPLFSWFGKCPKPDKQFLRQEVDAVRALDSRDIIITDSGELNHWQTAAGLADKLGITLYRIVWNKYLGFWDYFFVPPAAYRFKADITGFLNGNLKGVLVTELQMEPWTLDKRMIELTEAQQARSFDLNRFKNNISYVRQAGFNEVYLWGVEYWYWAKQQGRPEIWNEAKKLWQD